jgi:drug/metabolite transporter (DMT)-like permease
MKTLNASVAALSAVALWGLAFPLIQEGLGFASPILLGFIRFAFASLALIVILLRMFPLDEIKRVVVCEWRALAILAALYVTIPNVAQNIGLQSGTSSIACVIQSSGPVLTLMFAVALLGERFTRRKVVGTIIAIGGTVALVTNGGISLSNEGFVSNVFILASAVSYGLAWVSAKRVLQRNPPMIVIGMAVIIGTGFLGLALPLEQGLRLEVTGLALADFAVLGVFCAGLSSILYLTALRDEEVSRLAFFIYLMPVFASLFAWMIRGEMVEAATVACAFVIVVGIAIATREPSSKVDGGSPGRAEPGASQAATTKK